MKQIILAIMMLFTATAVSAQQKNDEDFGKRLYEARLAEVSLRLELTDKQKAAFAPIYEQYCKEMSQLIGRPRMGRPHGRPGMRPGGERGMRPEGGRGMRPEGPRRPDRDDEGDKPKKSMSDADKVKFMKERMEKQKKAQEIRLSYADKFATVLSDKQLVEFFEVENQIQDKMRDRVNNVHKKRK